jgi:hypothetical protein
VENEGILTVDRQARRKIVKWNTETKLDLWELHPLQVQQVSRQASQRVDWARATDQQRKLCGSSQKIQ